MRLSSSSLLAPPCSLRPLPCLQLVFYGSYHANPINQLIHFVFVPAIWWTVAGKWACPGQPLASTRRHLLAVEAVLAHPAPALPCCAPPLPRPAVWLAYTPPAFSLDLAAHLPACCAELAQQYLQFNGSFFLAAGYSLYYLLLEPFAGLSWAGNGCCSQAVVASGNAVVSCLCPPGLLVLASRPLIPSDPSPRLPCLPDRRPGRGAAVGPGQVVPPGGACRLGLGPRPAPLLLVCSDCVWAPDG